MWWLWWFAWAMAATPDQVACPLSVEVGPGLHDLSSAFPDVCLHYGIDRGQDDFHLEVKWFPRGDLAPRPLAELAHRLAGEFGVLRAEEIRLGDVSHGTVGGFPSAWVQSFGRLGASRVRTRVEVVNAPRGVAVLFFYGWSLNWGQWGDAMEAMRASMRFDEVDPAPWRDQPTASPEPQSLTEARAASGLTPPQGRLSGRRVTPGFAHPLVETAYSAPGVGGDVVRAAFQTPPLEGAAPGPAVVWLEGTPGGPEHPWRRGSLFDDRSALDLVQAGLVVFVPLLRGEHGEPGGVEHHWGEIDDVLAAVDHVRSLPHVDADRVYLVGHGMGGLQAVLATLAGAEVAATVAVEAPMTMEGEAFERLPHPPAVSRSEPRELTLRSPLPFAHQLRRPVHLFASGEGWLADAEAMAQASDQVRVHGVPVRRPSFTLAPVWALLARALPDVDASERLTDGALQEELEAHAQVVRTQWKRRDAKELDAAATAHCTEGEPLVLWFSEPGCGACEAVRRARVRGVLASPSGTKPPLVVDTSDRGEIDHLIEAFELYDLPEALVVRTSNCNKPLRKWERVRHLPVPTPPTDDALRAWWTEVVGRS